MTDVDEGTPTGFNPGISHKSRSNSAAANTGVSVESIRDYVDHRMQEADLRYNDRARFVEVSQREKWSANDSRLDGMNEIREAMKDQAARSMSRDEVDQLANTLRSERRAMVDPLRDKIELIGRPNWGLLASAFSVVALLVGGFWTIITLKVEAASAPLSTKVETSIAERLIVLERLHVIEGRSTASTAADAGSLTDRIQLNDRLKTVEGKQNLGLGSAQTEFATQQAAIREIETQLKSVSIAFNVQADYSQQMIAVLYAKAFGASLPATSYRPQLYK